MKRRSFLKFLGLAPAAAAVAEVSPVPEQTAVDTTTRYRFHNNVKPLGTYVGDGATERFIPHNLGFKPKFIMVKRTDNDWIVKDLK